MGYRTCYCSEEVGSPDIQIGLTESITHLNTKLVDRNWVLLAVNNTKWHGSHFCKVYIHRQRHQGFRLKLLTI